MKVIALPFAGGNKFSFNFFKPYLSKRGIKLETFEYPGRGQRLSQPFLKSADEIVDDILEKLLTNAIEEEYILYGHSLGALIGYLLVLKLEKNNLKLPIRLIISGRKAPSVCNEEKTYELPSNLFWEKVIDIGGTHIEVIKHIELKNFFEPILRSDFKIVEDYNYKKNKKINLPIDVFYGNEESDNEDDFLKWQNETVMQVNLYKCQGDHFFIYENAKYITNHFIQEFEKLSKD